MEQPRPRTLSEADIRRIADTAPSRATAAQLHALADFVGPRIAGTPDVSPPPTEAEIARVCTRARSFNRGRRK